MQLGISDDGFLEPGDFKAKIQDGQLMLPLALMIVLSERGIHTAESFWGHLEVFYSPLADALGWNIDELVAAKKELQRILTDHLPAENFAQHTRSETYGVAPRIPKRDVN